MAATAAMAVMAEAAIAARAAMAGCDGCDDMDGWMMSLVDGVVETVRRGRRKRGWPPEGRRPRRGLTPEVVCGRMVNVYWTICRWLAG